MARRTIVRLTDDLDGSEATNTVQFGWDGASYEIDLNTTHADQFATALAPYLAAARRANRRRRGTRNTAGSSVSDGRRRSTPALAAIRAWARDAGYTVADRGRIPTNVIDAYQAARVPVAQPGTSAPSKPAATQPARKTAAKRAPRATTPRATGAKAAPRAAAPRKKKATRR